MASQRELVLAFDLYGTLLSTSSIAKQLSKHFGDEIASKVATTWRTLQLEYTWRLNSMHQFMSFSDVTKNSLSNALSIHGQSMDASAIEAIMKAYDALSTFPDVSSALETIASRQNITAVVFSNGTHSMVTTSVNHSPDLAPYSSVFKEVVTVEEAGRFKPDPLVYKYLTKRVGKEDRPEDVWLISGNPFDVVGARSIGMQAAWVDREGYGWQDSLLSGDRGQPTVILKGLDEISDKIQA